MINRRSYSNDEMGMNEALNEIDEHGNGLNVSVTFKLAFKDSMISSLATISKEYAETT